VAVSSDFLVEEFSPGFRITNRRRDFMPEISIDEDGNFTVSECKIEAVWQRKVSVPTDNRILSQKANNLHFC